MAGLEDTIMKVMQKIAKRNQSIQLLSGVATEIGETTMTVEREGGPTLLDVRLNAIDDDLQSFVTIYPVDGSNVIVGVIEGMKTEAVLIRASEIEKIKIRIADQSLTIDKSGFVINDGNLGGMVVIDQITEKINELVESVNGLVSKFNSHTHTVSTTGTAAAQTGMAAVTIAKAKAAKPLTKSDYENKKIKQ